MATALYLKKIFFDKKSYLVNELGEPYLLIHQYDKRWEEFKKPLESFRTNIDIKFGAPDRSRTHNLRSRNPALYPVEATGAI